MSKLGLGVASLAAAFSLSSCETTNLPGIPKGLSLPGSTYSRPQTYDRGGSYNETHRGHNEAHKGHQSAPPQKEGFDKYMPLIDRAIQMAPRLGR